MQDEYYRKSWRQEGFVNNASSFESHKDLVSLSRRRWRHGLHPVEHKRTRGRTIDRKPSAPSRPRLRCICWHEMVPKEKDKNSQNQNNSNFTRLWNSSIIMSTSFARCLLVQPLWRPQIRSIKATRRLVAAAASRAMSTQPGNNNRLIISSSRRSNNIRTLVQRCAYSSSGMYSWRIGFDSRVLYTYILEIAS